MPTRIDILMHDIIYNLERYLYWLDEYNSEFEWTALKHEEDHLRRLRELLPLAITEIQNNDFDTLCG